jgi:hypothetical protein
LINKDDFMNKTFVAAAVLALLATAPIASFAEEAEENINPWGKCGIGAMIFDETPVAAAISNIIWDLGTTAVTSAGASKETCKGKEVVAAHFINETYANLEEETVQGAGQHLSAMLDIMGCDAASHSDIISSVRADFSSAMNTPAYLQKSSTEKAESYFLLVQDKATGAYASQCQTI